MPNFFRQPKYRVAFLVYNLYSVHLACEVLKQVQHDRLVTVLSISQTPVFFPNNHQSPGALQMQCLL
jgi:hypothetical protein